MATKVILATYKKMGTRNIVPLKKELISNGRKRSVSIRNPYFFCSQEPVADKWKEWDLLRNEGQIRHCVPYMNQFFDYIVYKEFSTLEAWFEDCRSAFAIPAETKMEDSIQYGRRKKCPMDTQYEASISLREVLRSLGCLSNDSYLSDGNQPVLPAATSKIVPLDGDFSKLMNMLRPETLDLIKKRECHYMLPESQMMYNLRLSRNRKSEWYVEVLNESILDYKRCVKVSDISQIITTKNIFIGILHLPYGTVHKTLYNLIKNDI